MRVILLGRVYGMIELPKGFVVYVFDLHFVVKNCICASQKIDS